MQIKLKGAIPTLNHSQERFIEVFSNQSASVEIYKPIKEDHQTPHAKDEIYIIASGSGKFYLEETKYEFETSDFIFVPAGSSHRFIDFTDDFSTWVIFLNGKEDSGTVNDGIKHNSS